MFSDAAQKHANISYSNPYTQAFLLSSLQKVVGFVQSLIGKYGVQENTLQTCEDPNSAFYFREKTG
jgi:hypothetical protein